MKTFRTLWGRAPIMAGVIGLGLMTAPLAHAETPAPSCAVPIMTAMTLAYPKAIGTCVAPNTYPKGTFDGADKADFGSVQTWLYASPDGKHFAGEVDQQTTKGLFVASMFSDTWVHFTNGSSTWAAGGPAGVMVRSNGSSLPWPYDQIPTPPTPPAPSGNGSGGNGCGGTADAQVGLAHAVAIATCDTTSRAIAVAYAN